MDMPFLNKKKLKAYDIMGYELPFAGLKPPHLMELWNPFELETHPDNQRLLNPVANNGDLIFKTPFVLYQTNATLLVLCMVNRNYNIQQDKIKAKVQRWARQKVVGAVYARPVQQTEAAMDTFALCKVKAPTLDVNFGNDNDYQNVQKCYDYCCQLLLNFTQGRLNYNSQDVYVPRLVQGQMILIDTWKNSNEVV